MQQNLQQVIIRRNNWMGLVTSGTSLLKVIIKGYMRGKRGLRYKKDTGDRQPETKMEDDFQELKEAENMTK